MLESGGRLMTMNRIITLFSATVATTALVASTSLAQSVAPIAKPTAPIAGTLQGGFDQAISALKQNQWGEAVRYFTPLVNVQIAEQRAQARYGLAISFSQLGEDQKALEILEGTLQDETPLGIAIGQLRGNLMLQLADKYLAEKGTMSPNPWLAQYERLVQQPNRDRYERISAASVAPSVDPSNPSLVLRVGVMLPLTGQLSDVGLSVLHGVQLGLKEFDGRRGTRVEMLVVDVSDAAQAKAAVDKLKNQQIDMVVGPLLAPAVTEVATALDDNIPILALSNDRSVLGKGVYTLNYLPGEQARLVARAAVSAGKRTLAVLAPSTPYGSEATEAFTDETSRLGAKLTGSSFFDPKATDVGASIRNIVGTNSSTVPFEALFVPAPASAMALLKAQLNYYNVDKANALLLGTGLWQNNVLLKPGTGLQGGLFAAPAKDFAFEQNYESAFGAKANALAVVGYDTARILADIAAEKQRTGQGAEVLLQRPEGFYGSGGYFRFSSNGLSQRGLDLVKVGDKQFEVQAKALTLPPLPLPGDLQPVGKAGSWNWR